MNELTKEEILLAQFRWAQRPHDAPLNLVQLRTEFGPPKPKVSELNVKQLKEDFKEVYFNCNGMHRKYEW